MFSPPPDDLEELDTVFDFADIPLDGFVQDSSGAWADTEPPDADNSVLADMPGHALKEEPRRLSAVGEPLRKAQVKALGPLRRELRAQPIPRKPLQGKDVIAIRRALSRAKIIRWKPGGAFSPVAGPPFYAAIRKFQKRKGLRVDGVYGNATHRALGPRFDAYAIKLYHDAKIGLSDAELKRQKFRGQCLYLYHMRHRIHYTMSSSRMSIVRRWLVIGNLFRYGDLYEDCSSIGKGLYKLIGHSDPNGFGYGTPGRPNTLGYTGTMLSTGFRITARPGNLKIADAFLTGSNPFVHTWWSIGGVLAMSHGKEDDPRIVPFDYRPVTRAQRYIEED